jgi:hypothetical protein
MWHCCSGCAPELPFVSDINECQRYPGRLCGHKCENTPGSYHCSCSVGFRLSVDGRSCEGEDGPVRQGRSAAFLMLFLFGESHPVTDSFG